MAGLVPFLSEAELRRRAAEFLAQHDPAGTLPVPIEEIIEFKLKLDIVPTPGLLSGERGINGYLSADRQSIYVDEWLFKNVESRYLFTLAHEVGHLVLHAELYQGFKSEDDWRAFHRRLAAHDLSGAEYQANTLAGLLLVPESSLAHVAAKHYHDLAEQVLAQEPGFDLTGDAFWSYVADTIGRALRVSPKTARIRLEKDGLWGHRL